MLRHTCIKSKISKQFFCERCQRGTDTMYFNGSNTYCEKCVTETIRKKSRIVDQNGEDWRE